MKPQTRKFEKIFNAKKAIIERKGLMLFSAMFRDIYKYNLDLLKTMPPQQWEQSIRVNRDKVLNLFLQYYQLNSELAILTRKHLLGQKNIDDVLWYNIFREKMRTIVLNDAGEKITSIVNTTEKQLKKTVREVLTVSDELGFGIDKIQRELVKQVGQNLKGNAYARARAIAQTEMISASNKASMEAANSTGYETRKFWSVSGLEHMRDSHIYNQTYSDSIGGLKMEERFPNGLLYPGDPSGEAGEVINCRCTILHEII